MKRFIASMMAVAALATPVMADVLANWTFETSVPTTAGPHAAELGSGSALGGHPAGSTYSNPAGNGSLESFSSTNWVVGDYYEFSTSSTGYQDLTFSIDHTSSNTGPRDFTVAYSTDGSTFTNFSSYSVLANAAPNPVWNTTTSSPLYTTLVDLSSETALDNAATVYFRVVQNSTVSANGGTVAATGTSRVDNIVISGTLIPEPASLALLALGALAMIRRR